MDDFRSIRRSLALLVAAAILGWGVAAFGPASEPRTVVEYQVIIREVPVPVEVVSPEPEPTPIADGLVDWDDFDRQTDCLWDLLQGADVELTLDVVLAAGTWADARGGACTVLEAGW
ncbi:MAG TPA: hypothetical protein VIG24_15265 [Acidimicrobiia bacterium]